MVVVLFSRWIRTDVQLFCFCKNIEFDRNFFILILNFITIDLGMPKMNSRRINDTFVFVVLIEREVVTLFFNLYLVLPVHLVAKALQTLVQLSSVRRMLFDTTDRQKYLDQLVTGLKVVLQNADKLGADSDSFHQFCRIVSRIKANYQVAELTKCQDFHVLLPLITQFTINSLQVSELFTQNSVFYLVIIYNC